VALPDGVDSRDRPAHGHPLAAHVDDIYFASRRARRAASSYRTASIGTCGGRAFWPSGAERRDAEGSVLATADRKLPLFEQPGHATRLCPTFFSAPTRPHCCASPAARSEGGRRGFQEAEGRWLVSRDLQGGRWGVCALQLPFRRRAEAPPSRVNNLDAVHGRLVFVAFFHVFPLLHCACFSFGHAPPPLDSALPSPMAALPEPAVRTGTPVRARGAGASRELVLPPAVHLHGGHIGGMVEG